MHFYGYPKKQQIVSEIPFKCDQAHLGMLLTNQITEFIKIQYPHNYSRNKIDFLYAWISKEANLIQTYIYCLLHHTQILSKVHRRYFQNEEFALYILRYEGTKYQGMK